MRSPLPLVTQIQAAALDGTITISDLLRLARVASSKLGNPTAIKWIEQESGGYTDIAPADLPSYRKLGGLPQFQNPIHGWRPLLSSDPEMMAMMSTAYLFESIGQLEHVAKTEGGGTPRIYHSPALTDFICKDLGFPTATGVALSRSSIWGVVDRVRTLVLDWSLELEQAGVIGESMTFTFNEKKDGTTVTNNYFANNIGVAGNVDGGSTVQNAQIVGAALDVDAVRALLAELRQSSAALPPDIKAEVEATTAELTAETSKAQPDQGRLRGLLNSMRSACEGASGSLVATGVVEAIKQLMR